MIHLVPHIAKLLLSKSVGHHATIKSKADEKKTVFEKYTTTERLEDIINTLKAFYFKLELREFQKSHPDTAIIDEYKKERLYLADIQQRYISEFSIEEMEEILRENLLPDLKLLQRQYPDI